MMSSMSWTLKQIQGRVDALCSRRFNVETLAWPGHCIRDLIVFVEDEECSNGWVWRDEMRKLSIVEFLEKKQTFLINNDFLNETNLFWWSQSEAAYNRSFVRSQNHTNTNHKCRFEDETLFVKWISPIIWWYYRPSLQVFYSLWVERKNQ